MVEQKDMAELAREPTPRMPIRLNIHLNWRTQRRRTATHSARSFDAHALVNDRAEEYKCTVSVVN